MKKQVILFLFIVITFCYEANGQGYNKNYSFLHSGSYVCDKNFYLLTLFSQLKDVNQILDNDSVIKIIQRDKIKKIQKAINCHENIDCHIEKYLWSQNEISTIGLRLERLAIVNSKIKQLIKEQLRPSGCFILFSDLRDNQMLDSVWHKAAYGMNHIIKTYALGIKPRYPDIDSVSYNINSDTYKHLINIISVQIIQELEKKPFYEPTLEFAISLLDINNRDEAGRFEPLKNGQNTSIVSNIKIINWSKYPYSVILVPGAGNILPNFHLSAHGKMRLKIAVESFKKGLAPIIAVSGGYVHPFQTPYCEAYEMKKYLIDFYHIPEKAIMIEPHARHTTTNIRNLNRLIYKYNIPINMRVLIITDQYQSKYIENERFKSRCMQELGYVPFKGLERQSLYNLSYYPVEKSLYYDSSDPLDP